MARLPPVRALTDLILPFECGGCGRPGTRWCAACAAELTDCPVRLHPRVDPRVPVWALGPYSGPRRQAVVAAKERGRRDLCEPLGAALAGALGVLGGWAELPEAPLVLVPAPTRARAARRRGGDPVRRMAEAAVGRARVCPALVVRRGVRDSVGLTAAQRQANLSGRVRLTRAGTNLSTYCRAREHAAIVVDDVLTTGTTAAESVRTLGRFGVQVAAVLVVAGV
ncbi:ComF family protein [Rhodococcus triatomae]|nr:ComF family protein [Rhodococcus triatomae]QNG19428.1 ComF family protein [Rhodococcus triatomae]QNG24659.1 ComF family protein [Rhodococcus triatomae]